MSIHKKLVLVLLAFTVLPTTVVGLWGFMHARETLEQMRVEYLEGLADQKSMLKLYSYSINSAMS